MPNKIVYFPALTGLRAIAAYLVFLHHFNPFYGSSSFGFIQSLFKEFHIGVSIFFVLSGFLISYKYYDNVRISGQWLTRYLKNRFARVYPMYFLLTTATFLVYWLSPPKAGVEHVLKDTLLIYIYNITFLKGFFDDIKETGIAQGWSLTVEECFYFTAPFIFVALRKGKILNVFFAVLGAGCILVLLTRLLNIYYFGFFRDFRFMLLYTFFGRCFEFFVGIKLALFLKTQSGKTHFYGFCTIIGVSWIFLWIMALATLEDLDQMFGLFHPYSIIINNFIVPIGIVLLLTGILTENTILRSILASRPFELLGRSSYVFYLIHMGFIEELIVTHATDNYLLGFLGLILISLIYTLALKNP
jgi:peptidoglycan/LPS O-acetylase OafA/YrhL